MNYKLQCFINFNQNLQIINFCLMIFMIRYLKLILIGKLKIQCKPGFMMKMVKNMLIYQKEMRQLD